MAHLSSLSSYPHAQHPTPSTSRAWTPAGTAFQTFGTPHDVESKRNTGKAGTEAYASSTGVQIGHSSSPHGGSGQAMRRAAAAIARDTLLLSLLGDSHSRNFAEER